VVPSSDKHESANKRVSGLNSDVLIAEDAFRHTILSRMLSATTMREDEKGAQFCFVGSAVAAGVEKIYTHLHVWLFVERHCAKAASEHKALCVCVSAKLTQPKADIAHFKHTDDGVLHSKS
jgi:hypothetical protein